MVIYSQRLVAKLMLKGFVLQGMDKNPNKSGKNVFFFRNSDELKQALKELMKQK